MRERNYRAVCEKHDWQSQGYPFKAGAQAARVIHNERGSCNDGEVVEVNDE